MIWGSKLVAEGSSLALITLLALKFKKTSFRWWQFRGYFYYARLFIISFNYYVCHWEDLFTKATGKLFVIYQPQIDDNLLITKIKYDLYQSVLKNISGYTPSKDSEKQETSHYMWNCFVLMVQFIQFILSSLCISQ